MLARWRKGGRGFIRIYTIEEEEAAYENQSIVSTVLAATEGQMSCIILFSAWNTRSPHIIVTMSFEYQSPRVLSFSTTSQVRKYISHSSYCINSLFPFLFSFLSPLPVFLHSPIRRGVSFWISIFPQRGLQCSNPRNIGYVKLCYDLHMGCNSPFRENWNRQLFWRIAVHSLVGERKDRR